MHRADSLTGRLEKRWRQAVWEEAGAGTSPAGAHLRSQLRAWETALRSFDRDLIDMRAHALTFRTLLSLVPFLAVAFSLFQAFGGLRGQHALQRLIVQNLAPGSAASAMTYVESFVTRISAGAIGGVGVVVLFFTVVSLLTYIEKAFNALWDIERVRPFFSRFVIYWAMITVGPVLLGLSLSMTSAAQSHELVVAVDDWVPGSARVVFRLVPWLVTWTGLTLLYLIVSNTHVRWRAAIGGGVMAGTLWELGKLGFTWASSNLFRYNAVYGSFGALPVFLLWLQIGWIIVLLGCKVSYALQHSRALGEEREQVEVGAWGREFLALRCMVEAARAYLAGEPPPTATTLAAGTTTALKAEQRVLSRLVQVGLLHAVPAAGGEGSERDEEGFVPARDASLITLEQVVSAFRNEGASPAALDTGQAVSVFAREVLERSAAAAASVTGEITLAEAVRRLDAPGA